MKLIKLHRSTGPEIYVNPYYIVSIESVNMPKIGCNYTEITLAYDDCCTVKETPEEVLKLINSNEHEIVNDSKSVRQENKSFIKKTRIIRHKKPPKEKVVNAV